MPEVPDSQSRSTPEMRPRPTFEIDGNDFSTLEEFFAVLGRVLAPGVSWGQNMDALSDLLHGGRGALEEGFVLRWRHSAVSRQRLGYPETVRQLEARLERCHPANKAAVAAELDAARRGVGPTVYDWLVEIIGDLGERVTLMEDGCRVFIATSLDGYIARTDGSIDWLEAANRAVPPGEDCGYGAFMASVDALVMGRLTFETVRAMSPWPYGDKPVYVLSRTLASPPEGLPPSVRCVRGEPASVVAQAAANGHRALYLDGGVTIQAFLAAGLVSELTITVIPVLLGAGRPLFGPVPNEVHLRLVRSTAYPFGFVQHHYVVQREAEDNIG